MFKYSEDYEMSLDKKSFMQLYSYNPERFREIALDYLMFKCKQKPLADDMKEYFRTYAEIDYGNNHE